MTYGIQTYSQSDLTREPYPLYPFNSSLDFHTLGDLHGNAVYLLHFLIHHGLARFKRNQTHGSYQKFRSLSQDPSKIDQVLDALEIAENAHIRLLGGLQLGHERNDFLTRMLITKIQDSKKAAFEMLASEYEFEHDTEYNASLDLLAYDHDEQGALSIYSRAPINEIDILRGALCLINQESLSKNDRNYLLRLQAYHPSHVYEEKLTNDDLIRMIGILNQFFKHMAKQNRLYELSEMQLPADSEKNFGQMYGGKGIEHKRPFLMFVMGRSDPKLRMKDSMVQSQCVFKNFHGYTSKPFESCHSLVRSFGRPDRHRGAYSVHVSRSEHSPVYTPTNQNWALPLAGAVLFLGIVALVIARVCTGEIGAFFALGAFRVSGHLIEGVPHGGVAVASVLTYLMLRPERPREEQYEVLEDGTKIRHRPSLLDELMRSCI